jgi:hypothetical protein
MNQGPIWGRFMKKTRGQKSRATVPLRTIFNLRIIVLVTGLQGFQLSFFFIAQLCLLWPWLKIEAISFFGLKSMRCSNSKFRKTCIKKTGETHFPKYGVHGSWRIWLDDGRFSLFVSLIFQPYLIDQKCQLWAHTDTASLVSVVPIMVLSWHGEVMTKWSQ